MDKRNRSMGEMVERVHERSLRLTVLGSGYVGLPTAALFADAGFNVTAVDVKQKVVKAVNGGVSPVSEPGLKELVERNVKAGRLKATLNSVEALNLADAVIISVQTPIDKCKKPNLSFLNRALEDIAKTLKKEMLIVVSSTVPPGTMHEKVKLKLESATGLMADEDFYLAYVPERIAPGKALKEFVESPRLIGGIGPNSTKTASALFKTVCKTVVETDVATAEIAKLAENTFRDVNIAFANQLALICERHGVDVAEVIKLANTHPRVNIHMAGPGVGGPCLPKDPYLLVDSLTKTRNDIIGAARRINDDMPNHFLSLILQALENAGKNVAKSQIAVLGIAYKGNVGDSRATPSKAIIRKLLKLGAKVVTYDPFCNEKLGSEKAKSVLEAVKNADLLALITDHAEFTKINLEQVKALMTENPAIVDGRRVIDPCVAERLGFTYYGIGFGKNNLK